jgi:hypothetical protein
MVGALLGLAAYAWLTRNRPSRTSV